MKLTNAIALISLALAGGAMPLAAQQPAQQLSLTATGVPKGKSSKAITFLILPSADPQKNIFTYSDVPTRLNPEPEPVQRSTKDFKALLVQSPQDLVNATNTFNAGNLSEARRQLASVRKKYEGFVSVPNNPSLRAARMELECYVRLMDWEAVEKLAASTPGARFLEAEDRAVLEAARLLSRVSDDAATAAARQKEIEAFLADSKSKTINSEVYSWLKYALGRAIASSVPAAELQNGISAENAEKASIAVDAFCECFASAHMRNDELQVDALKRAFGLLWAMPGVKSYALSNKQMDEGKWNAAPQNFRDAAALAFLLESVLAPEVKDANIQRAASLYFNRLKGKQAPAAAK